MRTLIVAIVLCASGLVTFATEYSDQQKLLMMVARNELRSAFNLSLRILEKREDADALLVLSQIYDSGNGVAKNLTKSEEYRRRAIAALINSAEKGKWTDYLVLSNLLSQSETSLEDKETSQGYLTKYINELNKRAASDDSKALERLAQCYGPREFVDRFYKCFIEDNPKKKVQLQMQAAMLGNSSAQQAISFMYYEGSNGLKKSFTDAKYWYKKFVFNDDSVDYLDLPPIGFFEEYIHENLDEAVVVLLKVASQGGPIAQDYLARIFSGEYSNKLTDLPAAYMFASAYEMAFPSRGADQFKNQILVRMNSIQKKKAYELVGECKQRAYLQCDEIISIRR